MFRFLSAWVVASACCLLVPSAAVAADLPVIRKAGATEQLIVDGKPYLILGGELGNSSAGTAAQADTILPRLAKLHVNTALIPVAWEQIEATEGKFDFSVLDHWMEVAHEEHIHLVLLWFGSWKNSVSSYTPLWVKGNAKRFPRAVSADGAELEILSTFAEENLAADRNAFSHLMKHVKDKDAEQQTVLMVQVENEVGYLGRGRDRSGLANKHFAEPVPHELLEGLTRAGAELSPELMANFHADGKSWAGVFGAAADEVFMAWNYAKYIQSVAAIGKAAYALPMYVNAQLPAPFERAGEYPSGGPHPYYLDVYRVAAPALDFYSPDIYWPNFEYWLGRYRFAGNAIFVPESRLDAAPFNALWAFGQAGAFGFCPFDIDSVQMPEKGDAPAIADTFKTLSDLTDVLIPAQSAGKTRGLVLHANSPRPTQTVELGGYLFDATLSRSWPARTLEVEDGAMIVIQTAANEFLIAGRGLTVSFFRDPDHDNLVAGVGSIEELARKDGSWVTQRLLNGDQSGQGHELSLAPKQMHTYRVTLYAVERTPRAQ